MLVWALLFKYQNNSYLTKLILFNRGCPRFMICFLIEEHVLLFTVDRIGLLEAIAKSCDRSCRGRFSLFLSSWRKLPLQSVATMAAGSHQHLALGGCPSSQNQNAAWWTRAVRPNNRIMSHQDDDGWFMRLGWDSLTSCQHRWHQKGLLDSCPSTRVRQITL